MTIIIHKCGIAYSHVPIVFEVISDILSTSVIIIFGQKWQVHSFIRRVVVSRQNLQVMRWMIVCPIIVLSCRKLQCFLFIYSRKQSWTKKLRVIIALYVDYFWRLTAPLISLYSRGEGNCLQINNFFVCLPAFLGVTHHNSKQIWFPRMNVIVSRAQLRSSSISHFLLVCSCLVQYKEIFFKSHFLNLKRKPLYLFNNRHFFVIIRLRCIDLPR